MTRTWWTLRRHRPDGGVEYLTAHGMKGFWFDIGRDGIVPGIVYTGTPPELENIAKREGGTVVEIEMDVRGRLREVAR